MKNSRQFLLGAAMFFGGGVLLYAMLQPSKQSTSDYHAENKIFVQEPQVAQPKVQPLTAAIEVEERVLEAKRQSRENAVAKNEQLTKELLAEQENARLLAMKKARDEHQAYKEAELDTNDENHLNTDIAIASPTTITTPVIIARNVDIKQKQSQQVAKPVQVANKQTDTKDNNQNLLQQKLAEEERQYQEKQRLAKEQKAKEIAEKERKAREEKARMEKEKLEQEKQAKKEDNPAPTSTAPNKPLNYSVRRGDGLIKIAKRYNVPVEALAQINGLSIHSNLAQGQSLTIPSKRQVIRLEREAKAEEARKEKERELARKSREAKREAQQKLKEARQEVKETDAKGTFGVQVALASNQAKADEIAQKFQLAGYQVKTSQTSRGVRVMVGPERGKVAALALRDKINSDPKVKTTKAWVLYWR